MWIVLGSSEGDRQSIFTWRPNQTLNVTLGSFFLFVVSSRHDYYQDKDLLSIFLVRHGCLSLRTDVSTEPLCFVTEIGVPLLCRVLNVSLVRPKVQIEALKDQDFEPVQWAGGLGAYQEYTFYPHNCRWNDHITPLVSILFFTFHRITSSTSYY